jgi:hypothetical protein
MTLDHINVTLTYVIWCEEHLWNVSELQRVHFSNPVTITTTTIAFLHDPTLDQDLPLTVKSILIKFSHLLNFPRGHLTGGVPTEIQYSFLVPTSEAMVISSIPPLFNYPNHDVLCG